jgi:mono/diheme cytochrome c family protein
MARGGGFARRFRRAILAAMILAAAVGCNSPRTLTPAQRGEVVYRTNCASCHSRDPNLPGPLGPPIAGSSRALVEARVIHGTYPPGYTPKRGTHEMRALPWLNGHIGDLTAYLDAAQDHKSGS